MANQGKHKNNLALELLEGEMSTVPKQSRGSHLLNPHIKKNKLAIRKFRAAAASAAPAAPDLSREPGIPPKPDTKHSPAASFERQRRLERLSQLRAPYQYKGH